MSVSFGALILAVCLLVGVNANSVGQTTVQDRAAATVGLSDPITDLFLRKNETEETAALARRWFGSETELCGTFALAGHDCVEDTDSLYLAEHDFDGDGQLELAVVREEFGYCGTFGCPFYVFDAVGKGYVLASQGSAQYHSFHHSHGPIYIVRLEDDPGHDWPIVYLGSESVQGGDEDYRNLLAGTEYEFADPVREIYGRYRTSVATLRHMDLIGKDLRWSGKHGVLSLQGFLDDPVAQEKLMSDVLDNHLAELDANGGLESVGRIVESDLGMFEVTGSGLVAASARIGAKPVAAYLRAVGQSGWFSTPTAWPAAHRHLFRQVEVRLRDFSTLQMFREGAPNAQ